jgi:hypothetical protein
MRARRLSICTWCLSVGGSGGMMCDEGEWRADRRGSLYIRDPTVWMVVCGGSDPPVEYVSASTTAPQRRCPCPLNVATCQSAARMQLR